VRRSSYTAPSRAGTISAISQSSSLRERISRSFRIGKFGRCSKPPPVGNKPRERISPLAAPKKTANITANAIVKPTLKKEEEAPEIETNPSRENSNQESELNRSDVPTGQREEAVPRDNDARSQACHKASSDHS